MPQSKTKLQAPARKLASNKALVRKGRSKPEAAVQRLMREADKFFDYEYAADRVALRNLFREARQSAARECAEIADSRHGEDSLTGQEIREKFNLEGK